MTYGFCIQTWLRILLIFFSSLPVLSPLCIGQNYHFKQYTANDGLPTNSIYGVLQDQQGFMWFYTEQGVSRFDGYQFKNFSVREGLPVNDVWLIDEDSKGRIWVNTFSNKLVTIEGDSVITQYESTDPAFRRFEFINDGNKFSIFEKGTDQILIPDSCCSHERIPFPEPLKNVRKNQLFSSSRDTFLLLHEQENKLTKIAGGGFQETSLIQVDTLTENIFKAGNTSIGTAYWKDHLFLWLYKDSLLHYYSFKSRQIASFNLKKIFGKRPNILRYYKENETLQIQTDHGLFILDDNLNGIDTFRFKLQIDGDVHRSFRDREGNYWIGTKDQGVFFLTARQRNAQLFTMEGQSSVGITHIEQSQNGTIVAGTRKGGLVRLADDKTLVPLIPTLEELFNDSRNVNAVCFKDDESLWLARPVGLERITLNGNSAKSKTIEFKDIDFKANKVPHYFHAPKSRQSLSQNIKDLAWHSPSNRLAVARGTHPYLLRHGKDGVAQQLELLTSKRAYSCTFSANGTLFLGHVDGLGIHTEETGYQSENRYELLNGLFHKTLVYDDANETLWIGTDGKGVIALHKGKTFLVPDTEGISINRFHLKGSELFVATNQGVKIIRIASDVSKSRLTSGFSNQEGLPSVEVSSITTDDTGIYAGSSMGFAKILKEERFFNYRHPIIHFTGIEADGNYLPPDTTYIIKETPNQLSFHFTGLSFKSMGNLRYFYQLEGQDKAMKIISERQVRYTNLSPGQYTFTVATEDINGQRSAYHRVAVQIKSNYWRQVSPWVLILLSLGLILWLGYRVRLHRVKMQTEQEQAINKQFAELELQALQAQMNPHFVFNSLSAIQYFIAANEKRQADHYLSKFAMLMRQFLESSKSRYLNLHQELHLIKLYIELEQMRFPDRFQCEIEVASDINPYTTLIPTMLLQPFVENAINHGLFHKMKNGKLSLNIVKNENQALICRLEDNGIGRAGAKGIQQKTGKTYRSRSTQITNERLHALRVIEGYDVNIEVIDLTHADGSAAGTRVIIVVPEIQ